MQVAAVRRGFRSLVNIGTAPARRRGAIHQTSASGQNGRTTRDFFHASEHRVRYNRRTKVHGGGACAPFHAGAPRRPCRARGGGVPLASPSVSSKIHRTAKPTELYKRGLCGLGSACNGVRMTSHTRHGFTWVNIPPCIVFLTAGAMYRFFDSPAVGSIVTRKSNVRKNWLP